MNCTVMDEARRTIEMLPLKYGNYGKEEQTAFQGEVGWLIDMICTICTSRCSRPGRMAGGKSMFVRAEVHIVYTGDVDGCTFERACNESTVLLLNYQATHTTPAEPVSTTPAKVKLLRFTGVYSTKAAVVPTFSTVDVTHSELPKVV